MTELKTGTEQADRQTRSLSDPTLHMEEIYMSEKQPEPSWPGPAREEVTATGPKCSICGSRSCFVVSHLHAMNAERLRADEMHPAIAKVAAAFEAEGASVEHVPPAVGHGEEEARLCIDCGHIERCHLRADLPCWEKCEPRGFPCPRFVPSGTTDPAYQARREALRAKVHEKLDAPAAPAFHAVLRPMPPGYELLAAVMDKALHQAALGKGAARHAQPGVPFEEQPLVQICQWLGSNHFALGQAIKKLRESARLPKEQALADILGAINYAAAAYLERERLP